MNAMRIRILGVVVGVLLIALVVDSALKSRADEADASSPRARYLDRAKIVATKRDLAAKSGEWAAALESARSAWGEVDPMLIREQTTILAEARFRDEVLAAASSLQLSSNQTASARSEPIAGAPGMHLLEVRLEVESNIVPDVLRLVDRLENMPDRLMGVTEVRLEGPGMNQAKVGLGAMIIVQSIGYVDTGAGERGAP